MNHDIIVIGGSAGAVEVLLGLAEELPRDLPAAVFIVLHAPAGRESLLPGLLAKRGPLPAKHPLHGEEIRPGTIYVAPPDNQLYLRNGSVEVVRGPTESGHRPAVDALFRTAAAAYGPRVVGVVLSGYQDCGTAGMMSVKGRGGIAIVQDPETAVVPEMPQSVLDHVTVDHVVHPLELPGLLHRIAGEAVAPGHAPAPEIQRIEGTAPSPPAPLVCPLCQGVLSESTAGAYEHFRCHVGHAFSLETLVLEQSESMERALWSAVRALDESAELNRRMSLREPGDIGPRLAEKAETLRAQADVIRKMLLRGDASLPGARRNLG